jgi:GMP synthase-like glutamine amidotransferase
VQFHPEATPAIIERLIRLRADRLQRVDDLLASVRDPGVETGSKVLRNFVRICLG